MGVTNKILSKFAKKVFVNFKETKGTEQNNRVVVSGSNSSKIQYSEQSLNEDVLNILVFGGSLGATQINEAIELLVKEDLNQKIKIIHQVG